MARISELEQRNADTLEVAISQEEYDRLSSGSEPLELRVTILSDAGSEIGTFDLPVSQANWVLDPDTQEYVYTQVIVGFGNHRTNWDGLVLSSKNASGLDTVEDAYMVGPFGLPVDTDGILSTTVTSATHIPIGTSLTLIDQSSVSGSGGGATLRFDAPDIGTPIVSRVVGLGDTGTGPIPCLVAKTLIATPDGETSVETLRVGDFVSTRDHGPQKIVWIGAYHVTLDELVSDEKLRPVLIRKGVFGTDIPNRDTYLSRQHRVLITSEVVRALCDVGEALVATHHLTRLNGIRLANPVQDVKFFHIMFSTHEVIWANGLPVESFLVAEQSLKPYLSTNGKS